MTDITIPNEFAPRQYQERPMAYLDKGGRTVMWIVHRRGGKDLTLMHQTCKMAFQRTGVYWHIYPQFEQARKAIWEGFRKDGKRIMENVFPGFTTPKRAGSIVRRKDEQKMMVELTNGSIWHLMGSDRVEVVGAGPVGVVFSEYALSDPRARNLIRPMLKENGGWEAYITTPRGKNHAYDLFQIAQRDKTWFCEVQTLRQTGAWREWLNKNNQPYSSIDEMFREEIMDGVPEEIVAQEYDCDWSAALAGSIWGKLLDRLSSIGGMEDFQHGRDNVFTTWDLGLSDDTAIWFWRLKDGGVDLIDFHQAHGEPLSYYFDLVDSRPFRYVKHWLPHDARQTTLASGVSILNQMQKHWPGQVAICPDMGVQDGIQAARWMLQQGVRFHPRCGDGISALRQYHYAFDDKKKIYTNTPVHDWSSHAADAFRGLASVVKVSGLLTKKSPLREFEGPERPADVPRPFHYSQSLDQLWEQRDRDVKNRRRF